ncbi:TetR/AcrR family transcriptional regulator [Oceanirhabdus seepicola]|uniref:TetR/AcrR family transcriptional regulator n=1 Tax=Oceanirhabdus seepicola TaxID=2828781 RepID=A0A9J6P3Q2_9CLOT|nr:TetR/AcrR family transcriptional regulator [Oceanirhabdus seepicola]MCM1990168.1 TetR/AcrR family transcriptional regulator [Oceanirhabdus seepicola]
MNGHEKRKLRKMSEIKAVTYELCNQYGTQKVSVDEVAERANVSKATIYKYFGSKEDLIESVVSDIYENIILNTSSMIEKDGDFLEKLNHIIMAKVSSLDMMKGDFLKEVFSKNNSAVSKMFNEKLKDLMYGFYQQGKEQGYIDEGISNDILYAFSEAFNAGFQAVFDTDIINTKDSEAMSQLINLYFHGFIKQKNNRYKVR